MRHGLTLLLAATLLTGCLGGSGSGTRPPADPFTGLYDSEGAVTWQDQYRFTPPPPPWGLLILDENDYSIAFRRGCPQESPDLYPCESAMAYAEEPFGYSRKLEERQEQFFRRFLWAARVTFEPPQLRRARALGGEALQADTVGHEPALGHKVLVRAVFARRDERVVAFYFTQWRPEKSEFDRGQLESFQRFVDSFGFTAPSFYQRLIAGEDLQEPPTTDR